MLTVYHGTATRFDQFFPVATYFCERAETAAAYAWATEGRMSADRPPTVLKCELNWTNPKEVTRAELLAYGEVEDEEDLDWEGVDHWAYELEAEGYDGLILRGVKDYVGMRDGNRQIGYYDQFIVTNPTLVRILDATPADPQVAAAEDIAPSLPVADSAPPTTLAAIADYFLAVYEDLFDPEDEVDLSQDADVREVLRRNYLHGDCHAFAVALHDRLGLPIVALGGGLHSAVMCPDGRLMDYAGVAPVAQVWKRYAKGVPTWEPWSREAAAARACLEEGEEGPWDPLLLARTVMDLEQRWAMPTAQTDRPAMRRPRRR